MDGFLVILGKILNITILDLFLSGDNVGLVAMATKRLPKESAKKAMMLGVFFAVFLRIVFACSVAFLMSISWLPINLIGGLILLKVTWDFAKTDSESEVEGSKRVDGFWKAVGTIVLADTVMSLDNVLAIAGAAGGDIFLIVFGIALSVPIIFFGSQYFLHLLNKYKFTLYVGVAVLAHTSLKMILEDKFLLSKITIPGYIHWLPWVVVILILVCGYFKVLKNKQKKEEKEKKVTNF